MILVDPRADAAALVVVDVQKGFDEPSWGISTTTRMAGNLGFDTYVVSDATATFDRTGPGGKLHNAEKVHEMSPVNLHEEFATVVSTAALVQNT